MNKNVAQIMDAFTSRPELAGHVRAIDIQLRKYAPLTQVLSLPLLKRCQRLKFAITWDDFPPRYVQNCLAPLLTNFASIVDLNFTARSVASAIDFFHIIWAMPQLLSCEFHAETRQDTPTAASLAKLEKISFKMKPRLLLETLIIDYIFVSAEE